MSPATEPAAADESVLLNLFCTREREAWRVYVRPTWLPRYLHRCFDRYGEAYPVPLDFEDLERHMQKRGVTYEKQESPRGDVELTARGRAANELGVWLSRAFASGIGTQRGTPGDGKKVEGA